MREIPKMLHTELMDIQAQRKVAFDDDPDSINEEHLEYIFTFRTRQAVHKKVKKLKEMFPILKDWKFGLHDLRRLKVREIAKEQGIEQAQKVMGHSSKKITMIYMDHNAQDLDYLKLVEGDEDAEESDNDDMEFEKDEEVKKVPPPKKTAIPKAKQFESDDEDVDMEDKSASKKKMFVYDPNKSMTIKQARELIGSEASDSSSSEKRISTRQQTQKKVQSASEKKNTKISKKSKAIKKWISFLIARHVYIFILDNNIVNCQLYSLSEPAREKR